MSERHINENKHEQNSERKLNMKPIHSDMIETVKDKIVAAIKGTGNVVQATVDSVAQILATTIKDTGKVGTSVTDVIADVASGAIRGAVQVGADLGMPPRGSCLGCFAVPNKAARRFWIPSATPPMLRSETRRRSAATLEPLPLDWWQGRSKAPKNWESVPRTLRQRLPAGL